MGRRRLELWGAMAGMLSLGGCGGGGSGVASTPAAPVTPIVPTLNDSEYQASNSAVAATAINAYNAGATGQGRKIAIIDSGLSDPLGEFAGRIDAASRGFAGNTSFVDPGGHGTSVAAVAAAGRNGSGIEGVAYGATVMALRSDTIGTCGTTDGCAFNTGTLATALDYAVANGATVVNLSLGGDAPAPVALRDAISRATNSGVLIVMSAGNAGAADPEIFAQVAGDSTVSHGLVVIAGAHDSSYASATFSNKAGIDANVYLAALGVQVRSFDNNGQAALFSGTSYAAPAIAAAIAILRSAFPNLTAAQTISLLYSSAIDAGAAGIDPIFGRGILNLTKAFQPAGTASLAGSTIPISQASNATLSAAMGDAAVTATSLGKAIFLDSYGRAYALSLANTIGRRAAARPLFQAIGADIRQTGGDFGAVSVSLAVRHNAFAGLPWIGMAQAQIEGPEGRTMAGSIVARVDRHTLAAFGFGTGAATLARNIGPVANEAGFLIAQRPGDTPGFDVRRGGAIAVAHHLGRFTLMVSAEQGRLAPLGARELNPPAYATIAAGLGRQIGPLHLMAGAGMMRETGSVLGSRFGAALGDRGAQTVTADLDAGLTLGRGWQAGLAWRQGWTMVPRSGLMSADATLASSAWSFDLTHVAAGTRFGIRIAQPLRVTAGGLPLAVPVGYDYASGAVTFADRRLNLAPNGLERTIEAVWGCRVGAGWIDTSAFVRTEPANIATAGPDAGAVLRYTTRW